MRSPRRGDFSARWAAYEIALTNGVMTANEVREAEGYNPHPDGNVLRTAPPAENVADDA